MLLGFQHLHRTLAYVVFLAALVDLALALGGGRLGAAALERALRVVHGAVFLGGGRLAVGAGVALWALLPQHGIDAGFLWASLALWLGVEVAARFLVRPEIAALGGGGRPSGRLPGGAALELVAVAAIFGLMTAGASP